MDSTLPLLKQITTRSANIGIIGMGYIGTSVAYETTRAGFTTIGFDINANRLAQLRKNKHSLLKLTNSKTDLQTCSVFFICVPTPLDHQGKPDLHLLVTATQTVTEVLHPDCLVILECSVAPGTTRNIIQPLLEVSGFTVGKNLFLSFSPERVDPGNKETMNKIPKVVSGADPLSLKLAVTLYSQLVKQVVPVATLEIAELTKVLENTFRLVNISFINEMAQYADTVGIDIWETIRAATTKPFGFLPHYPGPGAGGYCIPVLPTYLLEHAEKNQVALPIVAQALQTNSFQPRYIVKRAFEILQKYGKNGHSRVLLTGITYKKDVADVRESTALKIWQELEKRNARVSYHDPHIPVVNGNHSIQLTKDLIKQHDLVLVSTPHSNLDYQQMVDSEVPIFDIQNALSHFQNEHIYRL